MHIFYMYLYYDNIFPFTSANFIWKKKKKVAWQ